MIKVMGNEEIATISNDLRKRGFDHDFELEHEHIRCLDHNELIAPHDFEIMEIYYDKTKGALRNNAIIYGIKLVNYDIQGILISHYQSYLSGMSLQLWLKFGRILEKMDLRGRNKPKYDHLIILRMNDQQGI